MNLIYDRTAEDVETAKAQRGKTLTPLKGCYNYTDLNRVEAAVKTIAAELNAAGYPVEISPILKGSREKSLTLGSSDFQRAPYLYASGVHNTAYSDGYISTVDFFPLYGEDVIVTANIALGTDSGFLWYNSSKTFISGTIAPSISGYTMSATPPSGAKFAKFNLNASGVVPASITAVTVFVQGYTKLEYIKSDGNAYIDTGVYPTDDTEVELTFACEADGTIENAMFGAAWATNGFFLAAYAAGGGLRWHSGGGYADIDVNDLTAKHTVLCRKGSIAIDNDTSKTFTAAGGDYSMPIRLFSVTNTLGYANARNGIYKLYSCRIWQGNHDLIKNYVPAKRGSIAGVFDTVSGVFQANGSSSGAFTAGAEIIADREWLPTDIVIFDQWETYLANVQALRDAFYTLAETGELPAATDKLGWQGANTIERILYEIDLLIGYMKETYRRCGTFRAGENSIQLPLKGS